MKAAVIILSILITVLGVAALAFWQQSIQLKEQNAILAESLTLSQGETAQAKEDGRQALEKSTREANDIIAAITSEREKLAGELGELKGNYEAAAAKITVETARAEASAAALVKAQEVFQSAIEAWNLKEIQYTAKIAALNNKVSSLELTISTPVIARNFENLEEFEDWLARSVAWIYDTSDYMDYLQNAAYQDGYLVSRMLKDGRWALMVKIGPQCYWTYAQPNQPIVYRIIQ